MDIAVKDIGVVSAIGIGHDETLKALHKGTSGIGSMHYLNSVHAELPVGEVHLSNEDMKQMLCITGVGMVSRTALLGALALREATRNVSFAGKKTVLISGTTVGGMDITESVFSRVGEDDSLLPYIKRHDCGSCTHEIASILGWKDVEICTVSTACSAALNAVVIGCEMLKSGDADIVIAGGTEALSRFHLNGFNSLMILDKEPCRPFCKTRKGLNLGEGAAYVVLTRDAKPGDILVSGYGNRCDAYHQTASSPDGEGAFLAMNDALQMAGLKAGEIDYVNAHGTGTPDNDASESAALRRLFGSQMPLVSSLKGCIGHTTSASGAIEMVMTLLAMKHGFVPRNAGWRSQDENCVTPSTDGASHKIRHALCNAFGFGGNDSAVLLSACESSDEDGSRREAEKVTEAIVLADVKLDSMEQLAEAKEYIAPRESRRMGKLLKAATLTSLKALRMAGVETPDAIITATKYGMLENSERFLADMTDNAEQMLSPTLFMQSTHNTIGSNIAIRLGCHRYNVTYTQGDESLEWAFRDARRLIETGKARTVLVGLHDEATPLFQSLFKRMNMPAPSEVFSRAIVLSANKTKDSEP